LAFSHGWQNPAHDQLPDLLYNYTTMTLNTRRRVRKLLRVLRQSREDADYRPGITVNRETALNAVRDASVILRDIGAVDND
jgi:hypothetical protein